MNQVNTSKFDIAEYLDNEVMIEEYLNIVLEEGGTEDLIGAIGHIAKAKGIIGSRIRVSVNRKQ